MYAVVHFGGQHHGDLGVPAVIPGYTAPSQLGSGNSDITWYPNLLISYFNIFPVVIYFHLVVGSICALVR